jgi:type I restriction enzyme S subunit
VSEWKTAPLGEVCDLISRGVAPVYVEENGMLVVNQKCVRNHSVNYDLARRHDGRIKRVPGSKELRVGDVLVNSTGTGTLGRIAQVRAAPAEPTTVDTHVTIVRPRPEEFYPDFFGYILMLLEDRLAASGEGASGQTELARTTIEKFSVTYPRDREEQRRLVAVLDEAFQAIAVSTANVEKNLVNVRELFLTSLQKIFEAREGKWIEQPLSEVAHFVDYRGKTPPKRDEGIRLITAKNVKMGYIRREPEEFIDRSVYEDWMTRGIPRIGDVLFTTEAPLGNVAQLDTSETVVIGQRLITMQAKPEISSTFLAYMLRSELMQKAIQAQATGASDTNQSQSSPRSKS